MASGAARCAGLQPAVWPPSSRSACATAFVHGHAAGHPLEDQRRDGPRVEGALAPPGQVPGQHVVAIESAPLGEALRKANRQLGRPPVAVAGREAEQHAAASIGQGWIARQARLPHTAVDTDGCAGAQINPFCADAFGLDPLLHWLHAFLPRTAPNRAAATASNPVAPSSGITQSASPRSA